MPIAAEVLLQAMPSKVIGVTSVLPDEGKSTVAANFAGLLPANGSKTLLIDADLRNPGLSRMLASARERHRRGAGRRSALAGGGQS